MSTFRGKADAPAATLSQNALIPTHIMLSLSASRLNDFLGCPHQAALWLAGVRPEAEADAALQLIRNKGFEHEGRSWRGLNNCTDPPERIPSDGSLADRARLNVRRSIAAQRSSIRAL